MGDMSIRIGSRAGGGRFPDRSVTAERPAARHRLVASPSAGLLVAPSAEQRAVIGHRGGRLRVLAGPGTGKTATVVEAVADRIGRRGLDPSSILVLTFSRRAAAELSRRIAARLAITVTEPLVRTLHSYAYFLVRSAAQAVGDPPPRLLQGGQADLMMRDMLAGHAADGGGTWPAHLRGALRVPAFAAELREFVLRTGERQVSPRRIAELGRRLQRPEWVAAAAFITEYQDVGDLRQASSRMGTSLDQAELTIAALDRLADPDVLAAQQVRIRRIFVDEYQDVDPAQARMIDMLASAADELVVVGDPDQSIYAFRGAAPGVLERVSVDATVALTGSYRMPPTLLEATRRVARRLPGPALHRALRAASGSLSDAAAGDPPARLDIRLLPSAAQEAAYVADQLRRAHLQHGIAWSSMAVLLRSPAQAGEAVRRACAAAGVPVAAGVAGPIAANPLVAALLAVLRAGLEPATVTGEVALGLLGSPLGGMDPLTLRRLRRRVRGSFQGPAAPAAAAPAARRHAAATSADSLAAILLSQQPIPPGLNADSAVPLRRLVRMLKVAGENPADSAETVLWRVWEGSGLAARLLAETESGGPRAAIANSLLDGAVELFDRAAQLADQLPGAGVSGLLDVLGAEQVPGPAGRPRGEDAVSMLSAHAAKGLQWDVVAVPAVQQDAWPDLRPRARLLDLETLLDAAAGVDVMRIGVRPADARLADERRLFYVAVTRARRVLIVTAAADEENVPSIFLSEIAGGDAVPTGWPRGPHGQPRRAMNLPALVAELRRVVTAGDGAAAAAGAARFDGRGTTADTDVAAAFNGDGERGDGAREQAAAALAQLAAAGVAGAHPDTWYGLAEPSSTGPAVPDGAAVRVSPSQLESLLACPLRAVLERRGARRDPSQAQLVGIAVHALAQGIAMGATDADLDIAVEGFLAGQEHLPPWEVRRLRRQLVAMRGALQAWVEQAGRQRRFVGSEVPVDLVLPAAGPEQRPVRLIGRADWLSADRDGHLVVTDFKSGATPSTHAAAAENAQLAAYQLAAALGAFLEYEDHDHRRPGTPPADGTSYRTPAGGEQHEPGANPVVPVGGAELVYLRTGQPKVRTQAAFDEADRQRWVGRLRDAAASAAGAVLTARQGEQCTRCPVRASCPLQPEGRQVTG